MAAVAGGGRRPEWEADRQKITASKIKFLNKDYTKNKYNRRSVYEKKSNSR